MTPAEALAQSVAATLTDDARDLIKAGDLERACAVLELAARQCERLIETKREARLVLVRNEDNTNG